jgi:hypothetical protein
MTGALGPEVCGTALFAIRELVSIYQPGSVVHGENLDIAGPESVNEPIVA